LATSKVYRIYDEIARPVKHIASVVTDGKSASYVFPNRVEKSNSPSGIMKAALTRVGEAPDTPEGWAQLIYDVMPMTSIKVEDSSGSLTSLSRKEQSDLKKSLETRSVGQVYAETRDRELSDSINLLMIEKPDLAEFLETNDENAEEPESMRDYIRLILEGQGVLSLNPEIQDWLNGGEAPADFDGLVFFPETLNDKEEK